MSTSFRFALFELRTEERGLYLDGEECEIGSRSFDLLLALIERRDRVVTKNELLDIAWKGLVVEENNLSVQIAALRKVLGAHAITTVTGRGYRFTAACEAGTTPSLVIPQAQVERRIVVIACAEIVNWRVLLDENPASAVVAWQSTRTNIIESQVVRFGGQPIEITAGRLLIQFDSAVNAIVWGLDLQERLEHARRNGATPPLHMRVGVVVEDDIPDGAKLVMNVVHLMENLGRITGQDDVIVTDVVHEYVHDRLPITFHYLGDQQLPNFGLSVQIHRVVPNTRQPAPMVVSPNLMWGQLPMIAVLPFSVDADENKYFGDGITEEIITGLSTNRSLIVIARDSALRYRGEGASITAAVELKVRYIVVGSVRRASPYLRINVELIDAGAGLNHVIWSDSFKGSDDNLFTFQSQIAARITAAIDPSIREAEIQRVQAIQRVQSRPPAVFGAYEWVLRGIGAQFGKVQDFEFAGECFHHAIEIDSNYAQAHAHLARWYSLRVGEGRSTDQDKDRIKADEYSRTAIDLDKRDAWILATAGHIQSFLFKNFDEAFDMFDQALGLNQNSVTAWSRKGTSLAYVGRGDEALKHVENAMQLSPFDHQMFSFCTTNGIAWIVNARYDRAVDSLRSALRHNKRYRAATRLLIAAQSLAGNLEAARKLAGEFLLDEPTFSVSQFGEWYPLQSPHLERVLDGLRMAQLPD